MNILKTILYYIPILFGAPKKIPKLDQSSYLALTLAELCLGGAHCSNFKALGSHTSPFLLNIYHLLIDRLQKYI